MADDMVDEDVQDEVVADEAAEQAKIEARDAEVSAAMEKVFGDGPTPESDDESTPDTDDKPTPDAEEGEPADESDDDTPADEAGGEPAGDDQDTEPTLSAAELRAAKHAGWSDEDLDALSKANPQMAKQAAQAALRSMNAATSLFSKIGSQETPAAPTPQSQQKPTATGIDLSALEAEYKDDPIFPVIQQLAAQNAQLVSRLDAAASDPQREVISAAEQQEQAAIEQQITGFFNSPEVAAYADTYGDSSKDETWDTLTQAQIRSRMKVIEDANLIVKGAKQQGIDMPLSEAFERAHLVQVAPQIAKREREKIAASATKRQKGFTLKPTSSKKPTGGVPSTPAEKQAAMEAEVSAAMSKVFT